MAEANTPTIDDGAYNSSDYKIKSLSVITNSFEIVDLTYMMVELNIFEDIFATSVSGELYIADGQDIIYKFGLIGNETLLIEIDRPGLDSPIKRGFKIYSISDKKMDSTDLLNYKIKFCSTETVLSPTIKISKSYKGMRISQMVRDIAENYLKITDDRIFIEKTEGVFDIIIPYMDPMQAINWLATRAYSANKSAFLFYQNREGYNFVSYETLKKRAVYGKYTKALKYPIIPGDPSARDNYVKNQFIFNFLYGEKEFDVLKGIRYGAYADKVFKFDLASRSFDTKNFNAMVSKERYGILNKALLVDESTNEIEKTLYDSYESCVKYLIVNDTDTTKNPMSPQFWISPTISKLAQLTNFKMIGVLPGDVMLKCGSIIDVELPVMAPQRNETERDLNKRLSAKYMLSAVTHTFSGATYKTTVEMIFDSWGEEVNAALNSIPEKRTIPL
jgi:hypothetical protein